MRPLLDHRGVASISASSSGDEAEGFLNILVPYRACLPASKTIRKAPEKSESAPE
jgi:hypothetical protein